MKLFKNVKKLKQSNLKDLWNSSQGYSFCETYSIHTRCFLNKPPNFWSGFVSACVLKRFVFTLSANVCWIQNLIYILKTELPIFAAEFFMGLFYIKSNLKTWRSWISHFFSCQQFNSLVLNILILCTVFV